MPSEFYSFDIVNSIHQVNVSEFKIQNDDTKIKAFEKEIKFKNKVYHYLFKSENFNEDHEIKKSRFENFTEDLAIYFNY